MSEEHRVRKFFALMREREAIRLRRAVGQPWPWTDDPILREYKFTNVNRAHDRTSRLLIKEFYALRREADLEEILFNAAVFRYFGTIEFARAVGWSHATLNNLDRIEGIARERMAARERVYTGAYMVTNCGLKGSKESVICQIFLKDLLKNRKNVVAAIKFRYSMEDAIKALSQVHGFSTFMAKEVLLDTRYTDAWPYVSDAETWTAMGPGGRRGASWIRYGEGNKIAEKEALAICLDVYARRHQYWPKEYEPLTLDAVQFQFCEFYKYQKVKLGIGRPRSRYKGAAQ